MGRGSRGNKISPLITLKEIFTKTLHISLIEVSAVLILTKVPFSDMIVRIQKSRSFFYNLMPPHLNIWFTPCKNSRTCFKNRITVPKTSHHLSQKFLLDLSISFFGRKFRVSLIQSSSIKMPLIQILRASEHQRQWQGSM